MENFKCLRCGAEMVLAQSRIDLGGDGWNVLTSVLTDTFAVSVWVCPECGKVELFKVNDEEADPGEQVTCPECGAVHSVHINCPQCAAEKGFTSGFLSRGKEKVEKKERRKKNHVPWEL